MRDNTSNNTEFFLSPIASPFAISEEIKNVQAALSARILTGKTYFAIIQFSYFHASLKTLDDLSYDLTWSKVNYHRLIYLYYFLILVDSLEAKNSFFSPWKRAVIESMRVLFSLKLDESFTRQTEDFFHRINKEYQRLKKFKWDLEVLKLICDGKSYSPDFDTVWDLSDDLQPPSELPSNMQDYMEQVVDRGGHTFAFNEGSRCNNLDVSLVDDVFLSASPRFFPEEFLELLIYGKVSLVASVGIVKFDFPSLIDLLRDLQCNVSEKPLEHHDKQIGVSLEIITKEGRELSLDWISIMVKDSHGFRLNNTAFIALDFLVQTFRKRNNANRMFVNCKAGIGRTATLVALLFSLMNENIKSGIKGIIKGFLEASSKEVMIESILESIDPFKKQRMFLQVGPQVETIVHQSVCYQLTMTGSYDVAEAVYIALNSGVFQYAESNFSTYCFNQYLQGFKSLLAIIPDSFKTKGAKKILQNMMNLSISFQERSAHSDASPCLLYVFYSLVIILEELFDEESVYFKVYEKKLKSVAEKFDDFFGLNLVSIGEGKVYDDSMILVYDFCACLIVADDVFETDQSTIDVLTKVGIELSSYEIGGNIYQAYDQHLLVPADKEGSYQVVLEGVSGNKEVCEVSIGQSFS